MDPPYYHSSTHHDSIAEFEIGGHSQLMSTNVPPHTDGAQIDYGWWAKQARNQAMEAEVSIEIAMQHYPTPQNYLAFQNYPAPQNYPVPQHYPALWDYAPLQGAPPQDAPPHEYAPPQGAPLWDYAPPQEYAPLQGAPLHSAPPQGTPLQNAPPLDHAAPQSSLLFLMIKVPGTWDVEFMGQLEKLKAPRLLHLFMDLANIRKL